MFNFTDKDIVSGLEGCGKSSRLFEILKETTTPDRPVLFGVKNYLLMQEQIDNWSERYEIDKTEFAICGVGKAYEPALDAYTNPEQPYLVPRNCRFIFTSQANIVRNNHLVFKFEDGFRNIKYSRIVIDEFEFASCIVPTLAYELERISQDNIRQVSAKSLISWIDRNFTTDDRVRASAMYNANCDGFFQASWLENSQYPVTFLSSERLAVETLSLLGFNKIPIESPNFKDCVVNTYSSPYINRDFFNVMADEAAWNKLNYDLIISDNVRKHFENNAEHSLEVSVFSHTAIRGSNSHRDKNILTVLSYIPPSYIRRVTDALQFFGSKLEYSQVESLFYLDRLNQAVGRTLGHRGGKNIDLIVHQDLVNKIENSDQFPYTFNLDTDFENLFEGFYYLLERVKIKSSIKKTYRRETRKRKIEDLSYLDFVFEIDENAKPLTSQEVKNSIEQKLFPKIPATKVVAYFKDNRVYQKHKRVEGTTQKYLFGLKVK